MDIKTVLHPSYSPNLAPCDFWLFPKLRGCRYETIEEMKEVVTKVIDTLTKEDFHGAFQKLLGRYSIAVGRYYFEGDKSFMCVLSIKVPILNSLETYLMILVYVWWFVYFLTRFDFKVLSECKNILSNYIVWEIIIIDYFFIHLEIFIRACWCCYSKTSNWIKRFIYYNHFSYKNNFDKILSQSHGQPRWVPPVRVGGNGPCVPRLRTSRQGSKDVRSCIWDKKRLV